MAYPGTTNEERAAAGDIFAYGGNTLNANGQAIKSNTPVPTGSSSSSPVLLSTTQAAETVQAGQQTLDQISGSSGAIDARYQKLPTESIEQYNARVKQYYSQPPTNTGGNQQGNPAGGSNVGGAPGSNLPAPVTGDGNVSYINPATNQVQSFTASSLTPDQVDSLQSQGYHIMDSNGTVPNWITSGDTQLGRKNLEAKQAETEYNSLKDQLSSFTISDSQLAQQIQGITAQWDARIADMKNINNRREQGLNTTGLRLGSKYTGGSGGVFGGIISEEERQGVARIGELEGAKQAAIAAAREAARTKNWEVFSIQLTAAEKAYTAKQEEVAALNKASAEQSKKVREQATQASRDGAIASLMEQGVVDPTKILDYLNYDDQGHLIGDFTAKEVGDAVTSLAKANGLSTDKLTGEVGNFYRLKQSNNLPTSISSLPEVDQAAAYLKMVKAAETAPAQPSIHSVAGVGLVQVAPDGSVKVLMHTPGSDTNQNINSGNVDYSSFLSGRTKTQQTAFSTLPENDKASVAQLVNGDALISDLVKSRGAQGTADINRLIQEATKIDPSFSINTNKIRYDFMQGWNNPNGKTGTARNAINTALGHLADFKVNADKLDAGSIKKLNNVKNILTRETGDPKVLQLRTDINALASEIATIYKGGQPSEKEIANWESTIAADFSKAQFKGVSEEITRLLSSKITASRYQYQSTMGKPYPLSIIDPDKRQALLDAGIDVEAFAKENIPFSSSNITSSNHNGITLPGASGSVGSSYGGITLPH